MPIDASIYGMLQQPKQQPGPLDQYVQGLQVGNMMDQQQMNVLQRKQLEQQIANEPTKRMLESQLGALKIRKETADIGKTEGESAATQAKLARDTLAGVADQRSYDAWRADGTSRGWQIAKMAPEVLDQKWQQNAIMDADKWLAQQNSLRTDTRTREGQAETARHNLATETQAASAATAAAGNAAVNTEGKIRDDFNKASQEFVKVRDAHQRVLASAKDPSPAGDLALIFNYMKVLDPGSTVREGEFATAQNSGGISQLVQARYNKVLSGERLSSDIRNDFVNRSERLYSGAEKNQAKLEGDYTDIATRSKANPANVVISQRVRREDPNGSQERKTIGKQNYVKVNGQWFEDRP